jgi:hypothetical protein
MFKKTREAVKNFVSAHLSNQAVIVANQAQIISLLTQLNQSRTETLNRVTVAAEYLAKIEADKRQRSGHPTI